MNTKQIVALSLVLASGGAFAQQSLPTVEVRADSEMSLTISCDSPTRPSAEDVERVLNIQDPGQVSLLRRKLMGAAAEACDAGQARIQVTRAADGQSLTWKAM